VASGKTRIVLALDTVCPFFGSRSRLGARRLFCLEEEVEMREEDPERVKELIELYARYIP
jgi:hypothetical protein